MFSISSLLHPLITLCLPLPIILRPNYNICPMKPYHFVWYNTTVPLISQATPEGQQTMNIARRLIGHFPHIWSRSTKPTMPPIPAHYQLLDIPLSPHRRLPAVTAGITKRYIAALIAANAFPEADHLYTLIHHAYPEAHYQALRQPQWLHYQALRLAEITDLLTANHFDQADTLANQLAWLIASSTYTPLRAEHWARRHVEIQTQLDTLLAAYHFAQADALAHSATAFITPTTYLTQKQAAIQHYFQHHTDYAINTEQANALAIPTPHLLVKARAGSGKTRTIVAKAALAIHHEALDPDQVLLLAFNKDAADEMATRLRTNFGYTNFVTARTFHSLAYQIVRPSQTIVMESTQEYVLAQALEMAMTNRLYRLLAKAVRGTNAPDTSIEAALNPAEYLAYRRSLRLITLNGDTVKSQGEKWIADFLFEHDISFQYERVHYLDGQPYRPDFTLLLPTQPPILIEHWGVPTTTHDDALIFGGPLTARDYRNLMHHKRYLFAANALPLIESSIDEMRAGRTAFEAALATKLAAHGIIVQRLSEAQIQQKLRRLHFPRLEQMLLQFIQRAKSRRLTPADTAQQLTTINRRDRHTRLFWQLAVRVYTLYQQLLTVAGKIDFHDLLDQAANLIDETQGQCHISPAKAGRTIPLANLRWLLIDEFQDFSPAFTHLVAALRRHNPHLKLFCVGDDWQAINGFAGSDLTYFNTFTTTTPGAIETLLRTNYRSAHAIVDVGNKLMAKHGPTATPQPNALPGQTDLYALDQLWIHLAPPDNDHRFRPDKRKFDEGFKATRFIKFCWLFLNQVDPHQKIVILARTNTLYGLSLSDVKDELLRHLGKTYKDRLDVSTVHRYKGREADLAILADITQGAFPLIHTDTDLYAPLYPGVDLYAQTLAEERRLFYVALTRAKTRLCILTETHRQSPFLIELGLPITPLPTPVQPPLTALATNVGMVPPTHSSLALPRPSPTLATAPAD